VSAPAAAPAGAAARLGRGLSAPWLFSFAGAAALVAVLAALSGPTAAAGVVSAALTFGTFYVLVALGQMLVITLGPGNVDLSIPACMTLSGTVAMSVMAGSDAMLAVGLLASLGVGLAVGLVNYALIRLLAIPPIIATLSMSFVVQSTAIWSNRGLRIKPPRALAEFTTANPHGLPLVALVALVLSLVVHVVMTRTVYGRTVLAIGQNPRAARLAGLATERTRFLTYVGCALLAATCGYLLAGFAGGAALDMGSEYLLASIAVVVIGGTSVAGGAANVPGLWGASLFLFLLVSLLNTIGVDSGVRLCATGAIIVAVIVAASAGRR
jgi:ribose transport system permease protein